MQAGACNCIPSKSCENKMLKLTLDWGMEKGKRNWLNLNYTFEIQGNDEIGMHKHIILN